MACDICGRIGETKQTSDPLGLRGKIEQICPKCEKIANKMINKFKHMVWVRTKKKLLAMQKKYRKETS